MDLIVIFSVLSRANRAAYAHRLVRRGRPQAIGLEEKDPAWCGARNDVRFVFWPMPEDAEFDPVVLSSHKRA